MSGPLEGVDGVVELNAAGAERIAAELSVFSKSGMPCMIRYSSDQRRIAVLPILDEKNLKFMTQTKTGELKTQPFVRIVCWARRGFQTPAVDKA
jgi:hypothetical protein